jgi:membrane dipeptidase
MALPFAIDPEHWEIERVADHIDHAVNVMGIEHVGLGGDFVREIMNTIDFSSPAEGLYPAEMPLDARIRGLTGPQDYPNLVQVLRERGYADDRLSAILGDNFIRLFRHTLPYGERSTQTRGGASSNRSGDLASQISV